MPHAVALSGHPAKPGRLGFLWLLTAVTFPMFAVEFLRYDNESLGVHIALPMLCLGLIVIVGAVRPFKSLGDRRSRFWTPYLGVAVFLYLLCHLVGATWSDDVRLATREGVKLLLGIGSMWAIVAFFPRRREAVEQFWRVTIWSTTLLLIFLIYRYAIIFGAPYLGNHLDKPTQAGRNQLMWYVGLLMPYAVAYFWDSARKIFSGVPLVVVIVAWIYAGSRMAWIAAACGVLVYAIVATRSDGRRKYSSGKSLSIVVGIVAFSLACWWGLAAFMGSTKLTSERRFLYLYNPSAVHGLRSNDVRIDLIRQGLQLFEQSPIFGVGFMNSKVRLGADTHCDYMAILTDFGMLGATLFLSILGLMILLTWPRRTAQGESFIWCQQATVAGVVTVAVSMMFTNTYTATVLWAYLGLALVSTGTHSEISPKPLADEFEMLPSAEPAGY